MKVNSADGIGRVVRRRRKDVGLTQTQLAEKTGVTRQWLTRFENGNPEATFGKVLAVLRGLDLDLDIASAGSTRIAIPVLPQLNSDMLAHVRKSLSTMKFDGAAAQIAASATIKRSLDTIRANARNAEAEDVDAEHS